MKEFLMLDDENIAFVSVVDMTETRFLAVIMPPEGRQA
jgi:hypothetical protein